MCRPNKSSRNPLIKTERMNLKVQGFVYEFVSRRNGKKYVLLLSLRVGVQSLRLHYNTKRGIFSICGVQGCTYLVKTSINLRFEISSSRPGKRRLEYNIMDGLFWKFCFAYKKAINKVSK